MYWLFTGEIRENIAAEMLKGSVEEHAIEEAEVSRYELVCFIWGYFCNNCNVFFSSNLAFSKLSF